MYYVLWGSLSTSPWMPLTGSKPDAQTPALLWENSLTTAAMLFQFSLLLWLECVPQGCTIARMPYCSSYCSYWNWHSSIIGRHTCVELFISRRKHLFVIVSCTIVIISTQCWCNWGTIHSNGCVTSSCCSRGLGMGLQCKLPTTAPRVSCDPPSPRCQSWGLLSERVWPLEPSSCLWQTWHKLLALSSPAESAKMDPQLL